MFGGTSFFFVLGLSKFSIHSSFVFILKLVDIYISISNQKIATFSLTIKSEMNKKPGHIIHGWSSSLKGETRLFQMRNKFLFHHQDEDALFLRCISTSNLFPTTLKTKMCFSLAWEILLLSAKMQHRFTLNTFVQTRETDIEWEIEREKCATLSVIPIIIFLFL